MDKEIYAFFDALKVLNYDVLDKLLKEGFDVNSKYQNSSWLHVAISLHEYVSSELEESVKFLLAHDIDVNFPNDRGNTPLHVATRKGLNEVVRILLQNGADVDKKNMNNETALHIAANLNHAAITENLLWKKASTTEKISGYTPLLKAIQQNSKEAAEVLIRHGGNINSQIGIGHATSLLISNFQWFKQLHRSGLNLDPVLISGETYLTASIKLGEDAVAEYVIKNGAVNNRRNKKDERPLILCMTNKKAKLVKLIIEYNGFFDFRKDSFEIFLDEIHRGDKIALLEAILKKSNEQNFKTEDRILLIHKSIANADVATFEKLIKRFPELWRGSKDENSFVEKKGGMRESKATKDILFQALLQAVQEDNAEFLSYIFQTLSIDDQSVLFSFKNGIHHWKKQGQTLLQALAEKGEEKAKAREELIQMLVNIDENENGEMAKDPERVINQIKLGLHTSAELVVWIESVKAKYTVSKSTMIMKVALILFTLFFGSTLLSIDVGTDTVINLEWREFSKLVSLNGSDCENFSVNITEGILEDIFEDCLNKTKSLNDFFDCSDDKRSTMQRAECSPKKEGFRFNSSEWLWISNISLAHLVFPWTLFLAVFLLKSVRKSNGSCFKRYLIYMFNVIFFPFFTKWRVFWQSAKLVKLNSRNHISFLKEQTIRNLEKRVSQNVVSSLVSEAQESFDYSYMQENLQKLKEMNDEEFKNWIKYRPCKFLNHLGVDIAKSLNEVQRRDETLLHLWIKGRKNLKLVQIQTDLTESIKQETLSLVIEVAAEASFQFFIQVALIFPDLILNSFRDNSGRTLIERMQYSLNWKILSILSSFATMANSFTKIQILQKGNGLSWRKNPKPLVLLLLFNTLNTIGRIMVFGCFIYFTDDAGHFDIIKATTLYYSHALLMLFFNIIFNRSSFSFSGGYLMSLLLNSLTSFFSYNHFNFFESDINCSIKHEPTLLRQGTFYFIMMLENFGLILYFVLHASSFQIEDTFGDVHYLSNDEILRISGFIIVVQAVSLVIQLLYYESHPAGVSLSNLKGKLQIHILGTKWKWNNGSWERVQCKTDDNAEQL